MKSCIFRYNFSTPQQLDLIPFLHVNDLLAVQYHNSPSRVSNEHAPIRLWSSRHKII